LARDKAGKSMAARIAIIAMTTSSSISVKPRWSVLVCDGLGGVGLVIFSCLYAVFAVTNGKALESDRQVGLGQRFGVQACVRHAGRLACLGLESRLKANAFR